MVQNVTAEWTTCGRTNQVSSFFSGNSTPHGTLDMSDNPKDRQAAQARACTVSFLEVRSVRACGSAEGPRPGTLQKDKVNSSHGKRKT